MVSKTIKQIFLSLLTLMIALSLANCGNSSEKTQQKLIGTWVSPHADNQKLEIRTEELRFNHRRFDYTVDNDVLHLEETYPGHTIIGDMPFELNGDELVIDLGDEFSGFFYGRNGNVKLERK